MASPSVLDDAGMWLTFCELGQRFSGVSLEKRSEWSPLPWRVRLLPNAQHTKEYRFEGNAKTAAAAVRALMAHVSLIDRSYQIGHSSTEQEP